MTKLSKAEQCRKIAQEKSEKKLQKAITAIEILQNDPKPFNRADVGRLAGVSQPFLRAHPELIQAIVNAQRAKNHAASTDSFQLPEAQVSAQKRNIARSQTEIKDKDAIIQRLRSQNNQLQCEIDRLYGRLALVIQEKASERSL